MYLCPMEKLRISEDGKRNKNSDGSWDIKSGGKYFDIFVKCERGFRYYKHIGTPLFKTKMYV